MILLHNRTVRTKCCESQDNKCDEPDDDNSDERKFTLKIKAMNKSKHNNKNESTQTNDSNENHSGRTRVEYTRRQNSETAAIDEDYYENMSLQTNGISTGRNLSYGVADRRARRFQPSNQNPVNDYYENP